jgi:hypothetical protein
MRLLRWVNCKNCVREMSGSNTNQGNNYPYWDFMDFLSPFWKYQDCVSGHDSIRPYSKYMTCLTEVLSTSSYKIIINYIISRTAIIIKGMGINWDTIKISKTLKLWHGLCETKNKHKILIPNLQGKRSLMKARRRWERSNDIDIKEVVYGCGSCVYLL